MGFGIKFKTKPKIDSTVSISYAFFVCIALTCFGLLLLASKKYRSDGFVIANILSKHDPQRKVKQTERMPLLLRMHRCLHTYQKIRKTFFPQPSVSKKLPPFPHSFAFSSSHLILFRHDLHVALKTVPQKNRKWRQQHALIISRDFFGVIKRSAEGFDLVEQLALFVAFRFGKIIHKENAVQVIAFVLDATRQ